MQIEARPIDSNMANFGRCEKNASGFRVESSAAHVEPEGCSKVKHKGLQDGYGHAATRETKRQPQNRPSDSNGVELFTTNSYWKKIHEFPKA